ncbi:HNH endonuclease signature motif containing protein [Micromonospora sp. AMSO31t]|uniref:HNH endonuclease signature motif containing protein n=1 Tax=Micromonospora sp. AMSO31t TaxID=2650566 RepID=UPI00124B7B15|nr:HNH endonuclease signature motif containing protein [Micromonospora sp. AMSO31t]KAB1911075.1 HNH endonuclease [Micromonospora sp. AMSO31t]
MPRYKYSPERLAAAAAQARSVTEVMRLLGVRVSGGSHAHLSRQLKRFDIDTSHFTGAAHNKGGRGIRLPVTALLAKRPEGSRRVPGHRLKRALQAIGLPEECEACGIGATWQGAPLILHVDHINGDFLDNRPCNLRLLCPNCHSQTATYAGNRRPAVVAPDVVYDPEAVTPTGFPIGRRLRRRPELPWRTVVYTVKGS